VVVRNEEVEGEHWASVIERVPLIQVVRPAAPADANSGYARALKRV
jgi:hypothetical protein